MDARFDWYQAGVEADIKVVLGELSQLAPAGKWEDMQRAPHGYAFGRRLFDSDGLVAMVWWGGTHDLPHVVSSGETAQPVSELLRTLWRHRVARADPCIDWCEVGLYDRLQELALGVADELKIKVECAGDHLLTKEGRTLYLGARSSHTRFRLYDKTAELRHKYRNDIRCTTVPDNLVRTEFQVKPVTIAAKYQAARLSPIEVMGSTAWGRELMKRVGGLDISPFAAGQVWRQSDDDRAYAAVLAQYGGLFGRIYADLGSWACVGEQIGHDLARVQIAKRRGG